MDDLGQNFSDNELQLSRVRDFRQDNPSSLHDSLIVGFTPKSHFRIFFHYFLTGQGFYKIVNYINKVDKNSILLNIHVDVLFEDGNHNLIFNSLFLKKTSF